MQTHRYIAACCPAAPLTPFSSGRGDDAIGNPHRAQISRFEFFELILLLKLDKRLPVEQFEATVSQSTVPSPVLLKQFMPRPCFGAEAPLCR